MLHCDHNNRTLWSQSATPHAQDGIHFGQARRSQSLVLLWPPGSFLPGAGAQRKGHCGRDPPLLVSKMSFGADAPGGPTSFLVCTHMGIPARARRRCSVIAEPAQHSGPFRQTKEVFSWAAFLRAHYRPNSDVESNQTKVRGLDTVEGPVSLTRCSSATHLDCRGRSPNPISSVLCGGR